MNDLIILLFLIILVGCGKPKDGLNGANGAPGIQGPQGNIGLEGPGGPVGATGAAGAGVGMVQFCPSQGATIYPSTFPEYGVCVSGKLYAVYDDRSNNNVWLAEVVPGLYESTATGLGCTFQVLANCVIQ